MIINVGKIDIDKTPFIDNGIINIIDVRRRQAKIKFDLISSKIVDGETEKREVIPIYLAIMGISNPSLNVTSQSVSCRMAIVNMNNDSVANLTVTTYLLKKYSTIVGTVGDEAVNITTGKDAANINAMKRFLALFK